MMAIGDLKQMLIEALDDERRAEATYEAIIEKLGPFRPFINIVDVETRHSAAIEAQMRRLGIEIPANDWPGSVTAPATMVEACEAGIQGEIENVEMYDIMLTKIEESGVRRAFQNLRAASHDNHLPAFRRCKRRESRRG